MISLARAFAVFACLLAPLLHAQSPASLIGATDLLRLKQLGAAALSPDGKQVVYTVRSLTENSTRAGSYAYRTQLWIVSLDGTGGARQFTRGDASIASPEWHPSGERLAFVRSDKDGPQIWILPLASGGEAFPLTRIPGGASHPRWSPDGNKLLFNSTRTLTEIQRAASNTPGPRIWKTERPGRHIPTTASTPTETEKSAPPSPDGDLESRRRWLERREQTGNPRVLARLEFLGESDLEPEEEFSHLYVVNADGKSEPVSLTPGFVDAEGAEWVNLPAGPRVIFSAPPPGDVHPDRILERALWSVGLDGDAPRLLLHTPNFAYARPTASPDARTIAFLVDDLSLNSYGQTQLGVIAGDGTARKLLTTKLDRSAGRPKWSKDGKFVYFTAPTNGGHPLYRVRAVGGADAERLTGVSDGIRSYDIGAQHGVIVLTQATNPYELHRVDLATKQFRLLTAHNSEWLRTKAIASPQRRTVEVADAKFDAWIIKPAYIEPGKKYPLLVAIHGGPQGMWGPGDASMWHEFQYFASRGYGIVYCNPRGSGGYGYEFQRASFQNWGAGPAGDVLAAVVLATKEPWVDKERLVITGGSYGGYLVAWIIGHDRRFKAAIAQRGVFDLATFFGEGSAWRLVPYHFGGYPWQTSIRRLLDEQSPLSFAERIETPLMIQQGDDDRQTGSAQSEMLFRALKVLNRPVEYVRYPKATHDLSRSGEAGQRIDRLVRFDEFFRRFIGE